METAQTKSTNGRAGCNHHLMFFLFAMMISFVTNLAAPIGTIWKTQYTWSGMLGNMMGFLAYLFMGIPAGNLLIEKIGYKENNGLWPFILSALLVFQWLSGKVGAEAGLFSVANRL